VKPHRSCAANCAMMCCTGPATATCYARQRRRSTRVLLLLLLHSSAPIRSWHWVLQTRQHQRHTSSACCVAVMLSFPTYDRKMGTYRVMAQRHSKRHVRAVSHAAGQGRPRLDMLHCSALLQTRCKIQVGLTHASKTHLMLFSEVLQFHKTSHPYIYTCAYICRTSSPI
jgi:hypothetical protein